MSGDTVLCNLLGASEISRDWEMMAKIQMEISLDGLLPPRQPKIGGKLRQRQTHTNGISQPQSRQTLQSCELISCS